MIRTYGIILRNKTGNGIGSNITFYDPKTGRKKGMLTFHEGKDWQVTDSSRLKGKTNRDWNRFAVPALKAAREFFPNG